MFISFKNESIIIVKFITSPYGSADQILLVKSNIKQEYDSMDRIIIIIRL
jgi:hypothetical protein